MYVSIYICYVAWSSSMSRKEREKESKKEGRRWREKKKRERESKIYTYIYIYIKRWGYCINICLHAVCRLDELCGIGLSHFQYL